MKDSIYSKKPKHGRMTLTFLCCLAGLPICSALLEGVHAESIEAVLFAGAVLGVIYLLLRPILRLLTIPVGCLTMGLFGVALDTGFIMLVSEKVEGFSVDGIIWAFLCSLLINGMCLITGRFS